MSECDNCCGGKGTIEQAKGGTGSVGESDVKHRRMSFIEKVVFEPRLEGRSSGHQVGERLRQRG